MTHTPGPWVWHGYDAKWDNYERLGQNVIRPTVDGFIGVKKDDARLISAAPELLEALQGMVQWAIAIGNLGGYGDIDKAEAAIAKATGETA